MTTQTNVNRSSETIQAKVQVNPPIMRFAIVALLLIAVITAIFLVISPGEGVINTNNRAVEAQTARYQGLADWFAKKQAGLERGWQASAARYQGLADLDASAKTRAIQASAARYQGLAEEYAAKKAALKSGWDASAARYQALANDYALSKMPPAFKAEAARYQGLADVYMANNAALERGWNASAARYQGLAIYFEEHGK
jgi:hypothetical protein